MCSRCRTDGCAAALLAALLLAGCDRERREFESRASDGAPARPVTLSHLSPGPRPPPAVDSRVALQYEGNAYHIGEGQRLFKWYNCNGCHGNGGGSMGPALMDGEWRYWQRCWRRAAIASAARTKAGPAMQPRHAR